MAHRAGTAALAGRPNVGKSTLLNTLVGTKVSIVSPKPQTTRNRIAGIRTLPDAQVIFLDTPGIHTARSLINRRMVEIARRTLADADVIVVVLDATAGVTPEDRELLHAVAGGRTPTVVAVNKIDRVAKPALLPILQEVGTLLPGRDVVPVSARTGEQVPALLDVVVRALPEGPPLHPEDEFTAETERFLAQEIVREQLFRTLEQEVPYGTAVIVEEFTEKPAQRLVVVKATILVDRESHKPIVIGARAERLREIGRRAREELEGLLGTRVYLDLFVRVEPGWQKSPRRLAELGL